MKFSNKKFLSLICALIIWICFSNPIFAASLYFNPASITLNNGESGNITIYVDTQDKIAYGVEGVLNITGTSVDITSIEVTEGFDSSELSSQILDNQIKFRLLLSEGSIQGVQAIVKISYTTVDNGETELDFVTTGNFNTSLVAEEITGENILTSASGFSFDVNGDDGINIANDPTPTLSITPVVSPNNGAGGNNNGNGTVSGTPSTLPISAIDSDTLKVTIVGLLFAFIGYVLYLIKTVPELNIEFIGTKLKINSINNAKKKQNSENQEFEDRY